MMKRVTCFVFGIIFFCGISTAFADKVSTAALADKPIFQVLARMTSSTIKEIRDIGSLYEVVAENARNRRPGIYYVTKDEQYFIGGVVFDKNNQNITRVRLEEIDKIDFSQLPLENAIVTKKGTGAKKLAVFTDVDCPFCKKANDWLEKQDNYTLYTYLFPLDQIHPQAHAKSVSILCSKDENAALQHAFGDKDINSFPKKGIPEDQCEKMLAKHTLAAHIANATAVPIFIKSDGKKISGFNQKTLEDYFK
jgi:thiol:disulfide interchange protein DsbC